MADTSIALSAATAFTSGAVVVTASAPLFAATDVGRAIALRGQAPARSAAAGVSVGLVFVSTYAGVDRLYRVTTSGTTAAASMAGTTPNYDLNAPREIGLTIADGTATLKYLGAGKQAWGFGVISTYTDSQTVTVTVNPGGPFVATAATKRWRLGEFSDARGWPATATFHAGRTWWGGTSTKPQTLWSSATGDFENMTQSEPDGAVLDTSAITLALDDDQANIIRWLSSFSKGLGVGTSSGEWTVGPANANGALSPNNNRALRQTDRGSDSNAAAIRASGVILFLEEGGRKLRQMEYDVMTDTFSTIDLTQLSDHITATGLVELGYQRKPNGIVWGVRKDGHLATLTFDREQKVRAWTRQTLGGGTVQVESVAVVPAPDGTTDDVMLAVARTFGGTTRRTIEYVRAPFRADLEGETAAYFVDGGLSYSGTAANVFSGLDHLEGQTVQIVADGSRRYDAVVTGGTVTANGGAATVAHIGLMSHAVFVSLPPEAGAAAGTAQNQFKRISEISILFLESAGGSYGRIGHMEPIIERTLDMPMDQAVPLLTGFKRVPFPAGWDRAGTVVIETSDPLPLTVLALVSDVDTNG